MGWNSRGIFSIFVDTAICLKELFSEFKIGGPSLMNVGLGLLIVEAPVSSYKHILGLQ